MIAMGTLNALCEEAGLEPTRVFHIDITPTQVIFDVYSVDIYGKPMANAERTQVVSHWVKVQVSPE